jgi:hypothetical protein
MLPRVRFLVLLPLAALLACGSTTPASNLAYAPVSGDYVITVAPSTANASQLNGDLVIQGTSISGIFRYYNPGTICVSGAQDIPFTGSVVNSVMTLTSGSFSGSVATLTIPLPLGTNNVGAQVASGTAAIAGGTCALASTTLQIEYIPSYTAAWTIAFTSPSNSTGSLTVVESATADADGQFPATGTLTLPGGNGLPILLTGQVSGAILQLANAQSTVTVTANNAALPVTVSVSGTGGGTGTMTH